MIKHIWFDLAGTLYQETAEFNRAHNEFRYQTYAKLKNISDLVDAKDEYLELYRKYGSNSAVFTALGMPSNYWMQALEGLDLTAVIEPDKEVSDTLAALQGQLPISLFTNYPKSRIDELLEHLNISPSLFEFILSGDDIVARKPALDGFLTMVRMSKLPADELLYVGDRVEVDIKPAKAVGLKTCLIYGQSDEADYSIDSFQELLGKVEHHDA